MYANKGLKPRSGNHNKKYRDLTGQQFGRLIAKHYLYTTTIGNTAVWSCECSCGNTVEVRARSLNSGATKSCGCYQKDMARQSKIKADGVSALNILYTRYKDNARAHGRHFTLTVDEFILKTRAKCYYCNREPFLRVETPGGTYIYNGIDRLDNNLDYSFENTVSCCKWCNISKNNRTLEEFREWVTQVYNTMNEGVIRE